MTSRSIFKLAVAALSTIAAASVIAAPVVISSNIKGFNKVDLQTSGSLVLHQEVKDRVSVDVSKKMVPYVHIYKTGHTLHLGLKPHDGIHFTTKPHFVITMRDVNGISAANSADIDVVGPVFSKSLSVELHNSGQIYMPFAEVTGPVWMLLQNSGQIKIKDLTARRVGMQVNNSGHIQLHYLHTHHVGTIIHNSGHVNIDTGYVQNQNITVHNSGVYRAGKMISLGANINMRNSGEVRVRVNGPVSINKRGSGHIYLYGHPIINEVNSGHTSGVLVTD